MNIVYSPADLVAAKTFYNHKIKDNEKSGLEVGQQRIAYALSEEFHAVCMDKKEILQAEIQACKKLLKYTSSISERAAIEKDTSDLMMALDFLS